jgi:GNAT superfamily N-acetyltransferase
MPAVAVNAGSSEFRAVLALAKKAKSTVGFLTDSAFTERARQGTLLAWTETEQVVGYVLFDLPRDEIKIGQLVVSQSYEGRGLGRALLDEVAQRHPSRRGMLLHCRNDYPAHKAWPRLGFSPVGERIGGSIDGKLLTRWWKGFGHADLLTLIEESDARPTAVLDSCVFFEVVAATPTPEAEQMRADWLGDHVRLAITDEVLIEISNGTDYRERVRQRAATRTFATLSPPETEWRPWLTALMARHPDAPQRDQSDLRQLARALAAQASWFVTDDPALRSRYTRGAAEVGNLRVLASSQFLREVDEAARGDWYRPVELARTAVISREADGRSVAELANRFVNHRDGETIRQLRSVVSDAASRPRAVHLQVIDVDREARGLYCHEVEESAIRCRLMRVSTGVGESVIGRHLLSKLREHARSAGREIVRISDPHISAAVRRSLADEGFLQVGDEQIALCLLGFGSPSELRSKLAVIEIEPGTREQIMATLSGDDASLAAAAEVRFAPYRVVDAGLPTFIVPIRHQWATALFDTRLAESQLFHRAWDLGLRRELVYYRSPRNAGGLRAPARLLWYVSGARHLPGSRTIRGVSMLNEVLTARADHLFHRFGRLGVYEKRDVEAASNDDGEAMALRFSNTELFPTPFPLDQYRQVISGDPKSRSVVLQSPHEVDEHVFREVLERGTSG